MDIAGILERQRMLRKTMSEWNPTYYNTNIKARLPRGHTLKNTYANSAKKTRHDSRHYVTCQEALKGSTRFDWDPKRLSKKLAQHLDYDLGSNETGSAGANNEVVIQKQNDKQGESAKKMLGAATGVAAAAAIGLL